MPATAMVAMEQGEIDSTLAYYLLIALPISLRRYFPKQAVVASCMLLWGGLQQKAGNYLVADRGTLLQNVWKVWP